MIATSAPELAALAQVLASDARATMTLAMLDGRAWTLSELAAVAGVSRPTASEHIDRLVQAGLVEEVRQGRHRYARLGDAHVAETIEAFAALTDRVRPAPASLRAQRADRALRLGRSCYRHLAGQLGVALCDGMRKEGLLADDWTLTRAGRDWLLELGIVLPPASRRPLVRPCLDWTERRDHLAGVAADELLSALLRERWVIRQPDSRAIVLTPDGERGLGQLIEDALTA